MKEPGRELDAEIAVKVMGLVVFATPRHPNAHDGDVTWWAAAEGVAGDPPQLPHYSTDIAAAWLVVEKLQEKGQDLALVSGDEWANVKMVANAPGVFQWGAVFDTEGARPYSLAPTAPHAICLAALAAVGEGSA